MAKQTLKARKALKSSLRRKTPAPKAETQKKADATVVFPEPLSIGVWRSVTFSPDGLVSVAGAQADAPSPERNLGHREMIAPDIGCLNWQTHDGRSGYLRIIPIRRPAKPSLLSRIKAWWRR